MAKKRNIKLTLAYDGKAYHGWQRQAGDITIQEILEDSIETMINEPIKLIASGRTDAGVHALNQVSNFISTTNINPEALKRGLNSILPDDILVKKCEDVPMEFHSRYHAKAKIYEYSILNRIDPDIFKRHYAWHIRDDLDIDIMDKSLSCLIGIHDFSSFKSTGSANQNPVREIMRAELISTQAGMLCFIFEADGFLRHMVRNIIGTIVDIGLGKIGLEEFGDILESRDRKKAGIKAPPHGLYLVEVKY